MNSELTRFFYFHHVKSVTPFPSSLNVSHEKPIIIYIFPSVCNISFISCHVQDFLYVFGFQQFEYNIIGVLLCLPACLFVFVFILLGVLSPVLLGSVILCMSLILENFQQLFVHIFPMLCVHFLSPSLSPSLSFPLCFRLSHLYWLIFNFTVSSTQLYYVSDKPIECILCYSSFRI